MAGQEQLGDLVGHGAPDRCYFHAVGQTVVDKDAPREGKHLGLVLQPPERGGEDQTVEIALEIGA